MRKFKKITAVLLAAIITITVFTVPAMADSIKETLIKCRLTA